MWQFYQLVPWGQRRCRTSGLLSAQGASHLLIEEVLEKLDDFEGVTSPLTIRAVTVEKLDRGLLARPIDQQSRRRVRFPGRLPETQARCSVLREIGQSSFPIS